MFQFSGSPHLYLCIQYRLTRYCLAGFPHSEIHGSMLICSSPWLIAAYHVLLRLLMPRHSPCALVRLTSSKLASWLSLFPNSRPCQRFLLFPKNLRFFGSPTCLLAFGVSHSNDLSFSSAIYHVSKCHTFKE